MLNVRRQVRVCVQPGRFSASPVWGKMRYFRIPKVLERGGFGLLSVPFFQHEASEFVSFTMFFLGVKPSVARTVRELVGGQ